MHAINERIMEIINSNKDLSQKKMSLATGIPAGTINSWVKRGSAIPAEYIAPICDYLSVSTDYLLTGQENREIDNLVLDEKKLLQTYRRLDDRRKGMVQAYSDGMLASKEVEGNG